MSTAERQAEQEKKAAEQDSQLTELNIALNNKHRRLKQLQHEKQKREEEIIRHNDEKLTISSALAQKLEEKQAQILQKTHKLQELEANSGKMHKNLEKNFQNEIDEMNRKHDNLMDSREDQMGNLQSNLGVLNEFKDEKTIREENLDREAKRFEKLKRELDLLKRNGKHEQEMMKQKIQDTYAQNLEDFHTKAQSDAEKNISEIECNIQQQNIRLEEEALFQEQELEYLQLKTKMFEDQNGQEVGQLSTKVRSNQQIAVKQFEQNKKIKMLKTKIDLLESNLSQIVTDFEKERELIKFQNEQIIKEQNEELKSLTESDKLKLRESQNLKALCQMILDQRSDIEQFFLESLEQVKEEKRRKLETERNAEVQKQQQKKYAGFQQPHGFNADALSNLTQTKITVELADLDWEDRERILRLLFSKMNTGQSSTDWRDRNAPDSGEPGSSQLATGLGHSQREQEEEEIDDQDANVFEKTTIPPENYTRGTGASDPNQQQQYYDEEGSSRNISQYGHEQA